jgi:WD40 repeat protein
MVSIQSSGLVIAAGTYDGVLAGWEFHNDEESSGNKHIPKKKQSAKKKKLTLTFATAVHDGSIRSLCIGGGTTVPGSLLSCGYDEALKTHDWQKRVTSTGEIRTPSDFGTPVCSDFAPPVSHSTHCVIGFSNGKISIYKKRDWSVQHVLAGHEGGVAALAVHPTGKMALSGGVNDGKLKLWDLTKGRLAFVNKIDPASTRGGRAIYDPITSLVWSKDGDFYAMSHGPHVTVRQVGSGKTLLDVDLPSRVNQVTLMTGPDGLFVAAACNDGSLPVLAIEDSPEESRRAIMAIEPVDSHLAREERFKCIRSVRDYFVVTANSAGVVSLMDLQGAIKMIMSDDEEESDEEDENDDDGERESTSNEEEEELAVDIVESVQLGTGARITCLAAWCKSEEKDKIDPEQDEEISLKRKKTDDENEKKRQNLKKIKQDEKGDVSMDSEAVKKARSLVEKAKKLKKRREKKKKGPSN